MIRSASCRSIIARRASIDHRILERFYRRHDRGATARRRQRRCRNCREALVARLDALIDEQFDAHEAEVPPFNRTVRGIERRATKRILREFLTADLADLDAQELVPRWFEYRFGAKHAAAIAPPTIIPSRSSSRPEAFR